MKVFAFLISILFGLQLQAQFGVRRELQLPPALSEISGMALLGDSLWCLNDGGNPAVLHCLDTATRKITGTFTPQNGKNTDWEELCSDDSFLYIGDFGNNNGSRTNLHILRIPLDSLAAGNFRIRDTIHFRYASQSDFSPRLQHRYDCEAMAMQNGMIWLFTKNYDLSGSDVYCFPAQPGHHVIAATDTLLTLGLVTGACTTGNRRFLLCGYDLTLTPILWELQADGNRRIRKDSFFRYEITGYSRQSESIVPIGKDEFLLAHEKGSEPAAGILHLRRSGISGTGFISDANAADIYPNPFDDFISIHAAKGELLDEIQLTDAGGKILREQKNTGTPETELSTADLAAGNYLIRVKTQSGKRFTRALFKK